MCGSNCIEAIYHVDRLFTQNISFVQKNFTDLYNTLRNNVVFRDLVITIFMKVR